MKSDNLEKAFFSNLLIIMNTSQEKGSSLNKARKAASDHCMCCQTDPSVYVRYLN